MRSWVAALFLAGCSSAHRSDQEIVSLPLTVGTIVPTDAGIVYVFGLISGTALDSAVARVDPERRSVEIIARGLPLGSAVHVGCTSIYVATGAGIAAMPLTGGALEPIPGSEEASGLLFADSVKSCVCRARTHRPGSKEEAPDALCARGVGERRAPAHRSVPALRVFCACATAGCLRWMTRVRWACRSSSSRAIR